MRILIAALTSLTLLVGAAPRPQPEPSSIPMTGHIDSCKRYAQECDVNWREPETIRSTPSNYRLIEDTNLRVNRTISPMTDPKHHGVEEVWDMAESGIGDCEDYALLKRKLLRQAGVPHRAMRILVVVDRDTLEGHAVLLIRTSKDDIVLDNQTDQILKVSDIRYLPVKRESSKRAGEWIKL